METIMSPDAMTPEVMTPEAARPGAHVIEALAGVASGSALATALAARAEIMRLSQASHDAVLVPQAPGGISWAERAALAQRMAHLNANAALAAHYAGYLARAGESDRLAGVAHPGSAVASDTRLAAIVAHVDLLTVAPREATRSHIEALKLAGLEEADIVRLSELAAFVNYQVRVIAGLRLLTGVL
jgi:CMD domain protein